MGTPVRTRRFDEPPAPGSLEDIVPPRAVLTELARGFLMAQSADPERAKRFASSFLREQSGHPTPGRIVPLNRLPTVRRGIDSALGGQSGGGP